MIRQNQSAVACAVLSASVPGVAIGRSPLRTADTTAYSCGAGEAVSFPYKNRASCVHDFVRTSAARSNGKYAIEAMNSKRAALALRIRRKRIATAVNIPPSKSSTPR